MPLNPETAESSPTPRLDAPVADAAGHRAAQGARPATPGTLPPPDRALAIRIGAVLLLALIGLAALVRWQRPALHPPDGAVTRPPESWPDMRVDVNSASAAELAALPAIGPGLAEAIVADRAAHGPFHSLESLDRVPRIGGSVLDEIAPYVVFIEPPDPRGEVHPPD